MLPRLPIRLLLAALLVASLAACGGSRALAGTWSLSGVQGIPTPSGGTFVITFTSDGKVSGQSGCNTYSGSYTVNGQAIVFGPLAATKKACAAPLMTVETAYLTALQLVNAWQINDGTLTLSGPGGRPILTYTNNQG